MSESEDTNRNLKIIVKSSFIVFLAVLSSKLISYFYKVIVARSFGPEVYGLFSLGIIILGIFGAVAGLGLADGLVRYVPFYRGKDEKNKIKYLINKAMMLMIIASVLAAAVLFFTADLISQAILQEPELAYYLKILAISLPFSIIAGALLAVLRALENIKAYSFIMNFAHNLFKVIFLVILLLVGLKRDAILFSYVLAYAALAWLSYVYCKKQTKEIYSDKNEISNEEKKEITRSVFSYSWPLIFSTMVLGIFFWTDSLLLAYFRNAENVGLYNAAITLIGLFSISQDLFMQIFIPLISKNLSLRKYKLIRDLTKQIFKWVFILNLPLFIMLFLFPDVLINFFFGEEYISVATSLRILSLGAIFSGFTSLFIGLTNIKGNTKKVLLFFIIFSVFNVILDIFMIPKYGLEGAAAATAITWIIFTVTLLFSVKRDYGFYPAKRIVIKVFAVSLIPAFILYFLSELVKPNIVNLIVVGVIFLAVYLLLIFITGCFDKNDKSILDSIKDKIFDYEHLKKFRK